MKKIIALAVLGAFAAPAFADSGNVTISGDIRVGYQHQNKQASLNWDATTSSVVSHDAGQNRIDGRGNIYFKGSEDLGNGNSAIFQIGSRFSSDGSGVDEGGTTRTGNFGNRNTWVGLKGSWGTLRMGKGEDNYGDGKYDNMVVVGDSPLFATHASDHSDSNMARYDLPTMGGFSGSVQWRAGEDKTSSTKANDAYVLRGDYDADNWDVGVGYEGGRTSGDKIANYILAGGLKFGGLQLGLEYSNNKDKTVDAATKTTGLYATYSMDKLAFNAQYFRQKVKGGLSDGAKANTYALGVTYGLSKRTTAYAEYWSGKQKNPDVDRASSFLVGVKHSF